MCMLAFVDAYAHASAFQFYSVKLLVQTPYKEAMLVGKQASQHKWEMMHHHKGAYSYYMLQAYMPLTHALLPHI